MQAVNRKNKFAYFENCSRGGSTSGNNPVKNNAGKRA